MKTYLPPRVRRSTKFLGGLSVFALGTLWSAGAAAQVVLAGEPATQEVAPATDEAGQGADIVVTGSYLGNVRQEGRASPILTVDSAAPARTGVTSLGDLTRFIPQNIGSAGGLQDLAKGGADSRDTRSVNLRGIGTGATLVLLNGRRVTPQAGDDFVNLDSLTPDIAVARVETVLDGASSTYGADAVAGVFNVITDTRFRGAKVMAQYTGMDKSSSYTAQGMIGVGDDRFGSVTSVAYRFNDNLQNADRAITDFFNASANGFPGRYTLLGRPVTSSGGPVIINGNDYTAPYDARATGG